MVPTELTRLVTRHPLILAALLLLLAILALDAGVDGAKEQRLFAGARAVTAEVASVTKKGAVLPRWEAVLKWRDESGVERSAAIGVPAKVLSRPEVAVGDTMAILVSRDHPEKVRRGSHATDEPPPIRLLGIEIAFGEFWVAVMMAAAALATVVFRDRIKREAESVPEGWGGVVAVVAPVVVLMGPAGVWAVWEGLEDGARLGRVDPRRVLHLVVEGKVDRLQGYYPGRYRAYGRIAETGERTEVDISRPQFETAAVGRGLEVYALGRADAGFVTKTTYDAASPLIRLPGLVFGWKSVMGAVFLGIAVALPADVLRRARARRLGRGWEHAGDHPRGPVIVVRYGGVYASGSEGDSSAKAMFAFLQSVVAETRPAGVILDLTGLEYEWGDGIAALALALHEPGKGFRPAVFVATGRTAEAMQPLLAPSFLPGIAGMKLVHTREEAVALLNRALDGRQGD
jgi:hypothetical protein